MADSVVPWSRNSLTGDIEQISNRKIDAYMLYIARRYFKYGVLAFVIASLQLLWIASYFEVRAAQTSLCSRRTNLWQRLSTPASQDLD